MAYYHQVMDSTAGAGPSSASSSLWTEILSSADRQKSIARKNVIVLSEPSHGRRYLLDQIIGRDSDKQRSDKRSSELEAAGLALGYDLMDLKEEGDEDSLPPLSIYYPPSSHLSLLKLVPISLPPNSLLDTAVIIVLDWTKPSTMITELLNWLAWVEDWAASTAKRGEPEEGRDRLQSHLQHYVEPALPPSPNPNTSPKSGGVPLPLPSISTRGYASLSTLLPLGPGTLTRNSCGIPIIVACTRADQIDSVGEELGMKGGIAGAGKGWGWEERTDWVQQVLRTICLSYGASLFYTAPTSPSTYSMLRSHLLHRLYTVPPPLHAPTSATDGELPASAAPPSSLGSTRFPFLHRANIHDRDALMVPAGWDSWGKIKVLRDNFEPTRIDKAWEASLTRRKNDGNQEDEIWIEDLWLEVIPDVARSGGPQDTALAWTTAEDDQAFLAKQLDILLKDPQRDPRATFRTAAAVSHNQDGAAGVVGPMAGTGLSLPSVELAMKEMEGASTDDLKERFARLSRRESKGPGGMTSPPLAPSSGTSGAAAPVANEVLRDFFQGLLATRSQGNRKITPSAETSTPDAK